MSKKFGEKLDLDRYTTEQLSKVSSLIESKVAAHKSGKFNENLNNEEFHRLSMMNDVVKTALAERKAKPDFLDLDKDGNKKESMKKAASDKKKKKVDESMQTMSELADHHAMEYAKHHRMGNLEHAMHHKAKCEECGGMLWHGDVGECWMKHAGLDSGKPKLVIIKPATSAMGQKSPLGGVPMVTSEAKKAGKKPDFLDLDKDGNKKEPMKKAAKDAKGGKGKTAKKGMSAKQAKFFGGKKKTMKESIDFFLAEGEEGKAELIMAVKDMVDKFTGWSEDIAQMQAETAMEMSDAIRDELGNDMAQQFTQAVSPALDTAFQSVKAAREALNSQVAVITGEGGGDIGMGGDMGAPDAGADIAPPPEGGEELPGEELPPAGREKRESIERQRRLARILVGS